MHFKFSKPLFQKYACMCQEMPRRLANKWIRIVISLLQPNFLSSQRKICIILIRKKNKPNFHVSKEIKPQESGLMSIIFPLNLTSKITSNRPMLFLRKSLNYAFLKFLTTPTTCNLQRYEIRQPSDGDEYLPLNYEPCYLQTFSYPFPLVEHIPLHNLVITTPVNTYLSLIL